MKHITLICTLFLMLKGMQAFASNQDDVMTQTIILRGQDKLATSYVYDNTQREIIRNCTKNGLPFSYITSEYDTNSITQTTYVWQNDGWKPILRKINRTNEINQPLSTLFQTTQGTSFIDSLQISNSYNPNGTTSITQVWKNGTIQNLEKQEISQSVDSLTKQLITYTWNASFWQPNVQVQSFYFLYDNRLKIQRILLLSRDTTNTQWLPEQETLYYYDNGQCIEELTKSDLNKKQTTQQRILYSYNADTLLTDEIFQSWQSSAWKNELRYHYNYDAMHHLTMKTIQTFLFKQWQSTDQIQFSCNNDGKTLSAQANQLFWDTHPGEGFDTHMEIIMPQHTEILYGHQLNITYQTNSSITTLPNETSQSTITVLPNPSSNGIFFFSSSDQKPLSWTIYDIHGRIVAISHPSFFYIDLSFAPNGVYIAKMVTPNGIITKKLMVAKH